MEFYDVVAQVLNLLQRQGRVSYRALKRQFSIDDDYIEDLKEELLYAHESAVQADDRGFTWTGETEEIQVPTTQVENPPTEPRPREAERRQLTVMFCDLVDSTKLASQLDPEDYREVVRAYQAACTEVIQRYDGYIAQYLGDGLLVYFGYPQSHEAEAQRAVYTGLGILNTLKQLNTRLEQDKGIRLALRTGIHTGLVVVGDIGTGAKQEQLALGETPNVAARIQGLADPDTVVISEATYRLIQGYFDCTSMGEQSLRGASQSIPVYQVLQESGVQSRLDVASTRGLTPLVGREQEIGLLLERWEQAKDGQGQVVLLSGEAGIGKSRLVRVLREHVADEPHTRWECRSSPYYQNTALYPLIDLLQRALQWHQDDSPDARLEKLEHLLSQYRLPLEETISLFAPLLSLPIPDDRYPPLHLSPQRQRQKTLESIVAILLELAKREPVLFILEDLHWTDPTTLEFLSLLVEQVPTTAIYTLLTYRPHFQPSWHHRSYLTEITVNRLSRNQIERIAEQVAGGKRLPGEVLQQIVEKTDGVPLYCEEMTKALLESGHLKAIDEHYELTGTLPALAIPSTLQDSLMARLDRLMTAKGIAQLGATIGRQFSYELLKEVAQFDEGTLQRELTRLVEAELLSQRGLPPHATYLFKHALLRDAAYESLLRSTRLGYHRQIAEVLTARFPETVETQPELLAHHYTEAGLNEQAIRYWQQAGDNAKRRSAHVEAINHITKGLRVLARLSETPESLQYELMLQTALGPPLLATKGYASSEVGQVYTRARVLCWQVGEAPQLIQVLLGLWMFYIVRAELQTASDLGEQLLQCSQRQHDPALQLEAHEALGITAAMRGALTVAHTHFEQCMALYDPQKHRDHAVLYGQDSQVAFLCHTSLVSWLLGYPDQARQQCHHALTLATDLSHAFSVSWALLYSAMVQAFCRYDQGAHEQAEALIILCREQGFAYRLVQGCLLRNWVRAEHGEGKEAIEQIRRDVIAIAVTGAEVYRPYYLALLAQAYAYVEQIEDGLTTLDEALTLAENHGERWWEAELYRLQGELFLKTKSERQKAEDCFQKALEVSRHQQAKSLELRAATSLARLWQSQGKRDEARELLKPVYEWFTEGFDTADLIDAKALLEELK